MFTLETPRLCFRELTLNDYADAASVLLDDEIMQNMSAQVSSEQVLRWLNRKFEQYRSVGYSHWHVSLKSTGEFVGIIGIVPEIVEDVEYTGLGYLVKREFQRQNIAFEGSRACLEWAFRELKPRKVIAEIAEDNLPSRKLAERLGMICERTYLRFNGKSEISHCLYSIRRDMFSA